MHFKQFNLDPRLYQATEHANFKIPTAIQRQAIPICMKGSDIIGTAATGTGKTAAFVLPMLNHLLQNRSHMRSPRALIVTPTRELAEQIREVVKVLAKNTNIRSAVVYGGVGMNDQKRALTDGTDIIVCCPGRMLDHMGRGYVNLKTVEILVIDEADRMLDMGFLPYIKRIISGLPPKRQTLLFSATFAPDLMELIKHHMHSPERISIDVEAPAETIDHCFYPVPKMQKTALLIALLKKMDHNSILIFTRTKHRADRLRDALTKAGYAASLMHANKSQNQRKIALDGFRSGKVKILVATDIAARGLDIESISHVINYDIPDTATNYIHRIGRTGRAERSGDAITFITSEDASEVRDIERRLGAKVEKKTLEGFAYGVDVPSPAGAPHHSHARPHHGSSRPHSNAPRPHGQTSQPKENQRKQGFWASHRRHRS
ncbi:MAG TPA: RNA helicase [Lentisphaeria bacterium]|nr:MAG: RNA helicase [Lentisphaerae bacterium GWF2_50_93]HCE44709.1 RNA helicase [Lentisphaeria bacterium]